MNNSNIMQQKLLEANGMVKFAFEKQPRQKNFLAKKTIESNTMASLLKNQKSKQVVVVPARDYSTSEVKFYDYYPKPQPVYIE